MAQHGQPADAGWVYCTAARSTASTVCVLDVALEVRRGCAIHPMGFGFGYTIYLQWVSGGPGVAIATSAVALPNAVLSHWCS